MVAHILLTVIVQLTAADCLKCAPVLGKRTFDNAVLCAEMTLRKATTPLQVLINFNRRKLFGTTECGIRAGFRNVIDFACSKFVRKEIARRQLLIIVRATWIWLPEKKNTPPKKKVLKIGRQHADRQRCVDKRHKCLHNCTYFSHDVMHFRQNLCPQDVSCGSLSQPKQMPHSNFDSMRFTSSYGMEMPNKQLVCDPMMSLHPTHLYCVLLCRYLACHSRTIVTAVAPFA